MMTDEKTYTCPNCGDALKKIWSNRRQKNYFACQAAAEACGKFYSEKNGAPVKPVSKSEPDPGVPCVDCGAPMQKVVGAAHGDFYSCSKYPECKATVDLIDGAFPPPCPNDPEHGPMRRRAGKNGPFLSCRRYPQCDATQELARTKKIQNSLTPKPTKETSS